MNRTKRSAYLSQAGSHAGGFSTSPAPLGLHTALLDSLASGIKYSENRINTFHGYCYKYYVFMCIHVYTHLVNITFHAVNFTLPPCSGQRTSLNTGFLQGAPLCAAPWRQHDTTPALARALSCGVRGSRAERHSGASWAKSKTLSYGSNYTLHGGGDQGKWDYTIIYQLSEVMPCVFHPELLAPCLSDQLC